MSRLDSIFKFLLEFCESQGSACPLVLVFLICRLDSTAAHPVFLSTQRKISLFLTRLDVSGFMSLIHQFPALSEQAEENPRSGTNHSAHMLSIMQSLYKEKQFRIDTESETCFVPFQTSDIWTIQQDFYREKNMDAWDTVPFQISSNTYVAQQYAAEVERIIHDSYNTHKTDDHESESKKSSFCFVEIGAGHGILSFLLAKELLARQLKGLVICTDFHDTVFMQLLQLPWVREVCASGHLDFAVCGAATVTATTAAAASGLQLLYSGVNTAGGAIGADVLVIIGNYAFDSFPVDLVVGTQQGELYQIGIHEAKKRYMYPVTCDILSNSTEAPLQKKKTVKDFMKQLCMRQICPFCARSLELSADIRRNACHICCDDLSTAASASVAKSTEKSLLCRLLLHMTHIFVDQTCVKGLSDQEKINLPTGVFSVPVAATLMLQRIVSSFADPKEIVLLAGDCFVSHDDTRWQSDEFEIFAKHLKPKFQADSDLHQADKFAFKIPFFDPPLISPHDSALAVPVSVHGLWAAFIEVTGQQPSNVLSTSLHLADFSVVKFCGVNVNHGIFGDSECQQQHSSSTEIKFTLFDSFKININDYSTLRQLLIQDKEVSDLVTLQAVEELIVYSNYDLSMFLDLRWLIFSKLLLGTSRLGGTNSEASARKRRKISCDKNENTVELWLQISLKCMKNHYCMSWTDYICSMNLINQWLLALSSEQSLKECILNIKDKNDNINMASTSPDLDTFLAYLRKCDDVIMKSSISSNNMTPLLSSEVFVLQLKIKFPIGVQAGNVCEQQQQQQLIFNIFSWQDAVLLTLCFKKLGHLHFSRLMAQHLWEVLTLRGTADSTGVCQVQFSPGIFMKVNNMGAGGSGPVSCKKGAIKRLAQLRNRLRNLCQPSGPECNKTP